MEGYYDGSYIIFSAVGGITDNTEYFIAIDGMFSQVARKVKNHNPFFKVSVFLNAGVIDISGDDAKKFLEDWRRFKAAHIYDVTQDSHK